TPRVLELVINPMKSIRDDTTIAQMEAGFGLRSTFFVTTKYFADATDIGYYTPDRVQWIRQLKALGSDVGSHSVSHSFAFERFPTGSPTVDSASYDPKHPTVFGEARVSKQLLDRDLKQQTRGCRAGYLLYPNELLRVLEDAGYFFDSSVSAQYVLTNFPYFRFRKRSQRRDHIHIHLVPVPTD